MNSLNIISILESRSYLLDTQKYKLISDFSKNTSEDEQINKEVLIDFLSYILNLYPSDFDSYDRMRIDVWIDKYKSEYREE